MDDVKRCCATPSPRVGGSGRMYCTSCRQYLDRPANQPDPRRGADDTEAVIDTADQKGTPE